jgi:hypothetical protein
MKTIPIAAIAASVLCLAACGESSPASEEASPDTISVDLDGEGAGVPAQPDPDEASPAENPAEEVLLDEIPAAFRGVYDYVEGNCMPASDLRVEIGAKEMGFYESTGTVTGVRPQGEAVVVSLDMEGEGETWKQDLRIEAAAGTDRLTISDPAGAPEPTDYRKKCPA